MNFKEIIKLIGQMTIQQINNIIGFYVQINFF